MLKVAYVDASGSTQGKFRAISEACMNAGYEVFEFSSHITPLVLRIGPESAGTNVEKLYEHMAALKNARQHMQPMSFVVFTDDESAAFSETSWWGTVRKHAQITVVPARLQPIELLCLELAGEEACECEDEGDGVVFMCDPCRTAKASATPSTEFTFTEVQKQIDARHVFNTKHGYNRNHTPTYSLWKQHFPNCTYSQYHALFGVFLPPLARPQEAPMKSAPTVTTSVSLNRGSDTEITVADLKNLLVEVERVGGDDTAVVTLDQNNRCWTVALTVTLADEPLELDDDTKLTLLNELPTATRPRKAEIKTLLGL